MIQLITSGSVVDQQSTITFQSNYKQKGIKRQLISISCIPMHKRVLAGILVECLERCSLIQKDVFGVVVWKFVLVECVLFREQI